MISSTLIFSRPGFGLSLGSSFKQTHIGLKGELIPPPPESSPRIPLYIDIAPQEESFLSRGISGLELIRAKRAELVLPRKKKKQAASSTLTPGSSPRKRSKKKPSREFAKLLDSLPPELAALASRLR